VTVTPAVLITGWSNSGKTTVAVALIEELTRRGFRVGAIKHTPHGLHERADDDDRPGRDVPPDSVRLFRAGATRSITSGPAEVSVISRVEGEHPLEDLLRHYGEDVDVMVVEGYKRQPLPRVVVSSPEPLDIQPDITGQVIAVVGEWERTISAPRVSAGESGALADLVVERLQLRPAK
jgi:molybdopterin-guanine dinucleotide biosynthesis protein B